MGADGFREAPTLKANNEIAKQYKKVVCERNEVTV